MQNKPNDNSENGSNLNELMQNIWQASVLCQDALALSLKNKQSSADNMNFDPMNVSNAFFEIAKKMAESPDKLVDHNLQLAQSYVDLWSNITKQILGQDGIKVGVKDSRFRSEEWEGHPAFKFIKESYLLNSNWVQGVVSEFNKLDKQESRKVEFYTKLLIDSMAPTNFVATNPDVIKETMKTNGMNLVKGAENLMRDLSKSKEGLQITTSNSEAFEVGRNLALTEGKVVYQNDLMQLIQYKPTTKQVREIPVIIMPAWINKYYILDLQQKNSFVKWLTDQGFSVFMVSWVNPDERHADKTFDSYMMEGPLAAMEYVQKALNVKQVNFAGYCLGGTLLSCTLAYLKSHKKLGNVASATFLTSLVDFAEAGDLSVFIDDSQLEMLEKRMNIKGYLDGADMARTFNMIRANDMIWSFYINNYLMGKDPFPFDILYWNSDSTRLPAKMHSFYLRNMYQHNRLIEKNGIKLANTPIDLSSIDIPTYMLATIQDHIVPWKSAYTSTSVYGGERRFTLSGSGHVAGVVNHPDANKYNYWTSDKIAKTADEWLKSAKDNAGSWWVDWAKWLSERSGKMVEAYSIDAKKAIENAPGSFIKAK